ncbi:Ionotropic glutamate receptor [Corchorus olitorius]|uniref:Glutamate receptor n=1 Tax=Corchorus olitorius TaxID=93759 RepID=A0A1R3J6Y9_9ROSI|nr:Ionotropic glutamate receptor [Corchorus olitorius]
MQANFVIQLGNKSQVPIISFSATSPSLASLQSPYFFLAAQSASTQVKPISAIVQHFGWREAVPIYVDNQFGESIIPFLTDALQEINTRVPYLSVIPSSVSDDQIAKELRKLMNMPTRVFIVHMTISLGSRILTKANELGMMSQGYVWIMTDMMTALWQSINASDFDSMQGVLGVRSYVPKSKTLEDFQLRWKRKFQQEYPDDFNVELNILGLWAYDATVALAMAIEKAGTENLRFKKTNISGKRGDLETIGVSENGPRLIQKLSNTNFNGMSGDFRFVNRSQLQSSVFQIINVNGNGEKRVGFWIPKNGLVRNLELKNSTSEPKLGPIIWPGDTASVPKGWELPSKGKKLKIGVPVKVGFKEFVEVEWDSTTEKAKSIKGYSIDVFDAVMEKMPYAVDYEYVAFATRDGKAAGTYNDLTEQVYYGNYDAVVGDTTIVANRSLFVDFTMPYTESGVWMVVPIKDNKDKNAWVFLKPLTWDLWATSGCFFVFIGFVVWILEHRINEDFRGPPAHQIGTSFWFSFSTMVFAHRERVMSNLARFVVIIWCFVVLILTQSYTASLTSLLTVEQLQPTVTDISDLLKRRENVGFLDGSFVEGILLGLRFDKSQLKKYKCPKELDELFAKGSANGGISAALDEIPYIKLFLAKYCGKYTTVEPRFKTDGFGFVFPKGSPFVADVSRAVLNVTQSDKMEQIEKSWFKKETTCPDFNPSVSPNSLGLESFWGLFLIAAVASISALIIFGAMFLYEQRHVLLQFHSFETSIWRRILIMSRIFDQKDLNSHTFKKTESSTCSVHSMGVSGSSSPNSNCPPSPSSCSNQTDSAEFVFFVDQGRFSGHMHGGDITPTGSASPEIVPSPERSSIELANRTHGHN